MAAGQDKSNRRKRGFERAGSLMQDRIRTAGESRGFAITRLLTHWAEIVGEDTARVARPVKVSYAQGGFGATLTVLTTGAQAPMLQADLPRIRDRVNACYGYNAISRVRITQTSASGLAEAPAPYDPAPAAPDPALRRRAEETTAHVADSALRAALEALGENILSRSKAKQRQTS